MQQCKVSNNAVPCKVENESGGNGVNSGSVYNTMYHNVVHTTIYHNVVHTSMYHNVVHSKIVHSDTVWHCKVAQQQVSETPRSRESQPFSAMTQPLRHPGTNGSFS